MKIKLLELRSQNITIHIQKEEEKIQIKDIMDTTTFYTAMPLISAIMLKTIQKRENGNVYLHL